MTPREALTELAIALNHTAYDDATADLYLREIAGHDSRDVAAACQEIGRTAQWWPKLSELRAAIVKQAAMRERLTRGADDPSTFHRCQKCEDTGYVFLDCAGDRKCGRPMKGIWAPTPDGKDKHFIGSCRYPHTYVERCAHPL